MITMHDFPNREEWLNGRKGIGGSDAACVIGESPFKTNTELYDEKAGLKSPPNLDDNPRVQHGKKAERHIRELFLLDYPMFECQYNEFGVWSNDKYPWAFCTLDGLLTHKETGKKYILEIKDITLSSAQAARKWTKDTAATYYYIQCLHQMAVLDADGAYLRVRARYRDGEVRVMTYFFDRETQQPSIDYLMGEEERFWKNVEAKIRPNVILPLL